MYHRVRIYDLDWKKVDRGEQEIETSLQEKIVIKKTCGGAFSIFQDNELVAQVDDTAIKFEGHRMMRMCPKYGAGSLWSIYDGHISIFLSASRRYLKINNSEPIWIQRRGGFWSYLLPKIIDRNSFTGDKYSEVYFEVSADPILVICAMLVAVFESF